jgi:hypothetical protein
MFHPYCFSALLQNSSLESQGKRSTAGIYWKRKRRNEEGIWKNCVISCKVIDVELNTGNKLRMCELRVIIMCCIILINLQKMRQCSSIRDRWCRFICKFH